MSTGDLLSVRSFPVNIPRSLSKALDLPLRGVIPNHGDDAPPGVHVERLRKLAGR